MRIGLIDIDYNGSFPNIALMKISAWRKSLGDKVEWYMPFSDRYDIVYVSKVFSWSEDYKDVINSDVVYYGGTGYQIKLIDGKEVYSWDAWGKKNFICTLHHSEHFYPDYSLYPTLTKDTAYGFLTRGCPRGCAFCHVATKEGKRSVKVANLSEFWHGQKNIVLCDPNILACKDWRELLQQLKDSNAYIDFNQGLDARLLNEEKCALLASMKIKQIHFAWDRYEDGEVILPKLELFAQYKYKGKNPDHSAIVYTLVNFDTTIDQDLERIYKLRDMGYWAYVMVYNKEHANWQYQELSRWCNNRFIFAQCKRFEDYNPKIKKI